MGLHAPREVGLRRRCRLGFFSVSAAFAGSQGLRAVVVGIFPFAVNPGVALASAEGRSPIRAFCVHPCFHLEIVC